MVPAAAAAVTPLTTSVSAAGGTIVTTTPSLLATRATGNGTTTVNGTTSATNVSLGQFNTATGILVGARVSVAGVNTAVNAAVSGSGQVTNGGRTATADVNLVGQVTAAGITAITNASAAASRNCSGGNCPNSPNNTSTSNPAPALAGTATVAAGSLSAYAGAGTVDLGRSATGSSAITLDNFTDGSSSGSYSFTGGTYGIEYDYLNFAAPSFSGSSIVSSINLDFGTVNLNSGPVTLTFNLFNTGDINSAGLDLTGITRDNNDSVFSTTLTTFTNNLDAGTSRQYSITLDPVTTGNKLDRFRLTLRDFAPTGSVGQRDYALDVTVSGFVHDSAVVPEPATWSMLIAGYGIVGGAVRRRRRVPG